MKNLTLFLFACSVLAAGCSGSPATPTPLAPTLTTEVFNGTLSPNPDSTIVSSISANNFIVTQAGVVSVVLNATGPIATVPVGLGLGVRSGGVCTYASVANNTVAVQAGPDVYLSNVHPATFCVALVDIGYLSADITYTLTVVHP